MPEPAPEARPTNEGRIRARLLRPDEIPSAVDIEIWEKSAEYAPLGVRAPSRVKLNGVDVLMPDVTPENPSLIQLGHVSRHESLTATLTVFVRSLVIHGVVVPEEASTDD